MKSIAIVVLATCSWAGMAAGEGRGQAGQEVRDEASRMVDAYVLSNLQERLTLTDAQFVKLLPLVKAHQNARREALQRRHRALQELRRALHSGRSTEAQILGLLDDAKHAESEGPAAVARSQAAIDGQLAPVQQAKYRVFEAEVEQRLREMLRGVRGRALERRGRRGTGGPAAPTPDDDEP